VLIREAHRALAEVEERDVAGDGCRGEGRDDCVVEVAALVQKEQVHRATL
jgi:hypothetical protein